MEKHFELTDNEFIEQFQNCSFDPSVFTHEAHLRLAWIHIIRYGEAEAIYNIRKQLKRYVHSLGASEKYNDTVTVAAIKAVHHFIKKSDTVNFSDFISQNQRLKNNFRQLMASHYRTDIFNSPEAKRNYMVPELLAF